MGNPLRDEHEDYKELSAKQRKEQKKTKTKEEWQSYTKENQQPINKGKAYRFLDEAYDAQCNGVNTSALSPKMK